jgi:pimeloyl-ACP methyl ester carboxylesterase
MDLETFAAQRQFVQTSFGRIAYVEMGEGPAALFLHGVPLNGAHWRDVMSAVSPRARAIAIDLMGLGHSEVALDQDLTFPVQAQMALEVMDALGIDRFDLVGNDSGGAIAQILCVNAPTRVRSLTLTNCDCHDNWPPAAFAQATALAKFGRLSAVLKGVLDNLALARSDLGLGTGFERPDLLTADLVSAYIAPLVATDARMTQLDRYVASMDSSQTVSIYDALCNLHVPTQILWGEKDVFFPVEWARWLGRTIPGTTRVIEIVGARLFFAEERPYWLAERLIEHWSDAESHKEGRAS